MGAREQGSTGARCRPASSDSGAPTTWSKRRRSWIVSMGCCWDPRAVALDQSNSVTWQLYARCKAGVTFRSLGEQIVCQGNKSHIWHFVMHRFVDLTQTELKRGWTWIYIARFTDTVWYSKLPDTIKITEVLFRNGLKCWPTSLLISNPFRVYFQLKSSTVWWTLATLAVEFLNVLKTTPAKSMDHMTYVWHSCTTLGNLMRR